MNRIVYRGLKETKEGDQTGSRAKRLVEQYVAPDGSMEYILHLFLNKRYGSVDGRKIQVTFPSFDYQSDEKAGMPTPAVEGNWTLRSTTTIAPNTEIGDSGVVLLEAEIGQKTVCTTISFRNTTTVTRISPSDLWVSG